MGLEFLPICDVLFNVVSLASYFCDVVFDVIATYTFFTSGHIVFFSLSLVAICCSLIVCQLLSMRWLMSEERHRHLSSQKLACLSSLHLMAGGIIWRYSILFAPIQLEHVKQEMRNLCVLRMIHGFAESMPLLLIQTYIACTNPDTVKEINVISLALSLFNVCWALASFTKHIRSHNVHRLVLTWIGVIFQFIWRLGTISSRVLVLILYSSVYSYWVFLVVTLHWITMLLWVLSRYATIKGDRLSGPKKVLMSICVSYIHIFCYLNLEEKSTKLKIATFYCIMLVENILLVTLWALGLEYTPFNWDRTNILVGIFASFLIGLLFMVLYYRFFHVRKLAAQYCPSDIQEPGSGGVKCPTTASPHELRSGGLFSCNGAGAGGGYASSNEADPAVTVFNCALNPALRKKKKLPSRSVPPPPPSQPMVGEARGGMSAALDGPGTPFWKEPLPNNMLGPPQEERTAGDGLSYSRATSVDDIRMKLQEKREKQMMQLRRIEIDIASGKLERPSLDMDISLPIPGNKRQPAMSMDVADHSNQSFWSTQPHHSFQDIRPELQMGSNSTSYSQLQPELLDRYPPGQSRQAIDYQNHSPPQPGFSYHQQVQQHRDNVLHRAQPPRSSSSYHNQLAADGGNLHHLVQTDNGYHSPPSPGHGLEREAALRRYQQPLGDSSVEEELLGLSGGPLSGRSELSFSSAGGDAYQTRMNSRPPVVGYRDSSGEQGDVDSCEDGGVLSGSDLVPSGQPPPYQRLPLPLPRNRVVIGGYNNVTAL